MKKGYLAIYALMALNVTITTAFILFMPEEVPLHSGFSGEVDRIGSRYENLIIPALAIGIGAFLLLIARFGEKDNERTMVKVNMGMQVFLIALAVFRLSDLLSFDATDPSSLFDYATPKFVAIGLGILFIVFGNMLPKSNINSAFGIRTSWSMSSDETWQKTQRFGGYACIASGLLIVVFGILFGGFFATLSMMAVATICAIVCIIVSYRIYKNNPE